MKSSFSLARSTIASRCMLHLRIFPNRQPHDLGHPRNELVYVIYPLNHFPIMRINPGIGLLAGLSLASAPLLTLAITAKSPTTPVVTAKSCEMPNMAQPAARMRLYRDRLLGFTFEIPVNYRSVGVRNGAMIMNAASYHYFQCIQQNKIATEFPPVSVKVDIAPIQIRSAKLYDHVITAMPFMKSEGMEFTTTNFADRDALTYRQKNLLEGGMTHYVSFLSNDRHKLITLSGPAGGAEFEQALQTFRMK
ncbi:hypothetical protein IQ266_21845 [filamentous cyanobacterium LEGE 11480]|uniref:Uncharacterized protein n=1 Tax=Romeriopsis navalis LEGE 11480 TaxID=2777977 RepID=A0A928VQ14_9CYAN|nr:hypothetical protein [Romeriopsis navalis]MBE9032385.1 hypothetical protein [Romeriopsis navalis LEGE 11480]